jgi:hypothetical protein
MSLRYTRSKSSSPLLEPLLPQEKQQGILIQDLSGLSEQILQVAKSPNNTPPSSLLQSIKTHYQSAHSADPSVHESVQALLQACIDGKRDKEVSLLLERLPLEALSSSW